MKTKHKSGFSLIEIMVSVIILVVLALGGAAVMYQTGGGVQRQQNKREAIVAANWVLEALWSTNYVSLAAAGSATLPTAFVNEHNMPVKVSVTPDPDTHPPVYYDIEVTIDYMTGDDVVLVSRRYEKGLSKATVD